MDGWGLGVCQEAAAMPGVDWRHRRIRIVAPKSLFYDHPTDVEREDAILVEDYEDQFPLHDVV